MKVSQDEVVDRQTVLHIELEDDDLGTYLERGYRKFVQHANIPGFRKGKAPRQVVEGFFGRESLLQEALDFMLPDVTRRAVEEQDLETAGMPKIELEEIEPVKVKATIALAPAVDLGAYRDIRIEEPKVEVSDEDVEKELENLRTNAGSWVPVERPVQLGDMVGMKAKGTVDDRTLIDDEDTVHIAEEGAVVPLPGFSEKLVGAVEGEPQEFSLEIPDDHADTTLAGKVAQFLVTVNEVKERQLPDLDDELAKGVGDGYESLDALRGKIESDLRAQADRARDEQFKELTIDALVESATIELPELLVEHEIEHMVDRRDRFIESIEVRLDDYLKITGKTEDETLTEMREHSIERLSRTFALSKLAELETIEVTDDDITEEIESMAETSEDPSAFESNPRLKSDEVRDTIRESLLMKRAVERLGDLARGESGKEDAAEPDEQQATEDEQENGGDADDPQT